MSCDGCKAKDVGACTAHGGTGWDPRTGKTPCPHAPQIMPIIDAEEEQRRARAVIVEELPWLCRDCQKTPEDCGKSIEICERKVWRENEYERGHATRAMRLR